MKKDYLGPSMNEAGNGVRTDLRFKLAVDILKSGMISSEGFSLDAAPALLATLALDLAVELVEQSEKRGWLHAMPEDGELTPEDVDAVKRNAASQVIGQLHAQKVAENEASRVMTPQIMPRGRLNG